MNVVDIRPWIDPRVRQVRPEQAKAYLLARGWTPATDNRPYVWAFEPPSNARPSRSGVISLALVPNFEPNEEYYDFVFRLITVVAVSENRLAADVLTDMLAPTPAAPANGAADRPRRSARKRATG
jgi:hypothetical protein